MKIFGKVDHLLLLRGFASFNVVWYHTIPLQPWLVVPFFGDISFIFTPQGAISVYIFYLLSGYGVGFSFFSGKYRLSKASLLSFYKKRLLRIVPAYVVCLIISIFVIYKDTPISWYDFYRFFTFTANIDYLNLPYLRLFAIISTEMQFYLLAPLLFLLLSFLIKKTHVIVAILITISLGYGIRYMLQTHGLVPDSVRYMQNIYVNTLAMIDYFLIGMICSYIILNKQNFVLLIKKTKILFFIIAPLWFFWTNYNLFTMPLIDAYLFDHMYVIPISIFLLIGWYILLFGSKTKKITSITQMMRNPLHLFHIFGVISFGLYLYHTPVTSLLSTNPIYTGQHIGVQFLLVILLTIFASLLSYFLVEKPLLRK